MTNRFRRITNVLIVILACLSILFLYQGVTNLADAGSYDYSEDSFLYALEDNRYSDLVDYYYNNLTSKKAPTETMLECYAIANYYEASIEHAIALLENDADKLRAAEAKMEQSAASMGSLSYAKAEIDALISDRFARIHF